MSYKDLEIWKLASEVIVEIHHMTLSELPKFEMFEMGGQIRRSSKSVKSNIVEGYGRRQYKKEFLHFLNIALASNIETIDHLETLHLTGSLKNLRRYEGLYEKLTVLGKQLRMFIRSVQKQHRT